MSQSKDPSQLAPPSGPARRFHYCLGLACHPEPRVLQRRREPPREGSMQFVCATYLSPPSQNRSRHRFNPLSGPGKAQPHRNLLCHPERRHAFRAAERVSQSKDPSQLAPPSGPARRFHYCLGLACHPEPRVLQRRRKPPREGSMQFVCATYLSPPSQNRSRHRFNPLSGSGKAQPHRNLLCHPERRHAFREAERVPQSKDPSQLAPPSGPASRFHYYLGLACHEEPMQLAGATTMTPMTSATSAG